MHVGSRVLKMQEGGVERGQAIRGHAPKLARRRRSEREAHLTGRHRRPERLALVEPGHPHAQEPHRAPRVKAAQQLDRNAADGGVVVDRRVERAGLVSVVKSA